MTSRMILSLYHFIHFRLRWGEEGGSYLCHLCEGYEVIVCVVQGRQILVEKDLLDPQSEASPLSQTLLLPDTSERCCLHNWQLLLKRVKRGKTRMKLLVSLNILITWRILLCLYRRDKEFPWLSRVREKRTPSKVVWNTSSNWQQGQLKSNHRSN